MFFSEQFWCDFFFMPGLRRGRRKVSVPFTRTGLRKLFDEASDNQKQVRLQLEGRVYVIRVYRETQGETNGL